jgi:hypothetical protein
MADQARELLLRYRDALFLRGRIPKKKKRAIRSNQKMKEEVSTK